MENNMGIPSEEVDTIISSKPEEILSEEPEEKGPGKIITIVTILVVIALGIYFWKSGCFTTPVETITNVDTILVIEPRELTIDMNNSAQIRVYIQGADIESREEITDQAEWYSSNLSIVTVGNTSVKGQVVSRDEEGRLLLR